MAKLVNCVKLGSEEEGLDSAPFPGPKGQYIYDNVSQKAWQEWLGMQTMLINENHLA
ncbi:MAG: oxidative damage protection protein, partial [Gammaproteobacteria bacterium]